MQRRRTINVVSALTARTQLGQIIRRATQRNERFIIDRRGQPSVVIMGLKDYIDAIAPPPPELLAMQRQARKTGVNKLSSRKIDDVIAEVRAQKTTQKITKRQTK
jgi:prevent-host-death family protein